jgi:putative addiction module component (TIGR02574 family)
MTQTKDQILAAAMSLPPEARTEVAERLLDSLQESIDEAWVEEARARLRDLDEGRARTIPADEVFRALDERLHP